MYHLMMWSMLFPGTSEPPEHNTVVLFRYFRMSK